VLQAGLVLGCLDQGEAHRCCTPGDRPQRRHRLLPGIAVASRRGTAKGKACYGSRMGGARRSNTGQLRFVYQNVALRLRNAGLCIGALRTLFAERWTLHGSLCT
jgi:hypothetical protein